MIAVTDSDPGKRLDPSQCDLVYMTLARLGECLQVPIERSRLDLGDIPHRLADHQPVNLLIGAGRQQGISIKETKLLTAANVHELVVEGYPVVLATTNGTFHVAGRAVGRRIELTTLSEDVETLNVTVGQLRRMMATEQSLRSLVAKRELECDPISAATAASHHHHGGHEHLTPLRRFLQLLRLDTRDIWTVTLFALVSGTLALATPLAIESLVNVVSWGTYWQPLLVLAMILLACLGISGVLLVLQYVVVEVFQRRQLVRFVGDLAHRFPRANQQSLVGEFPRELANRVFDIMTIQKATAILLLDGLSIVLTTVLGMLLLAFYHPFLLGFSIVLLFCMLTLTWVLGRGGIRTAIEESITKYRIAHWLQDVLASPTAFKINGGEALAIDRANRLATDYLLARQDQFRVIIRQVALAIGIQAIASTALLGLGGWLVIQRQLTLGQLVASELIVTFVVGAFAKIGKSLEKFYDLMAGVEKIGHLLDIPVDPRRELGDVPDGPAAVRWDDLSLPSDGGGATTVPSTQIDPAARVAIVGENSQGRSALLRVLAGLSKPSGGFAEVAGADAQQAAVAGAGRLVGYAGPIEIFHSSLRENVDLGRTDVGRNRVREVLGQVGLWSSVIRFEDGMGVTLQTGGYPLTESQAALLMIARAMAGGPKLLLIDSLLDRLNPEQRRTVWKAIASPEAPWTLIVATNRSDVAALCGDQVHVRET